MVSKCGEPSTTRDGGETIALFGGVYNNYLALESAIVDARKRGATAMYCLGDLGAFGPHPNRVFPLLIDNDVRVVQGNYDESIGRGLDHCQCGYTDARDNQYAAISYAYTFANTDARWRPWLADLPKSLRLSIGGRSVLLCHGSPRFTNEFLWESTTSTAFLNRLSGDYQADVVCATHTGIKWKRELDDGRLFVNVGVLGRPENDGKTVVWYTLLRTTEGGVSAEFVPVIYDHERLATEMRSEGLPGEFIETVLTGWWTTCLEILPGRERSCGRY
jgi:diadenosine tetraphosphatase ApaH/serine/threonine PP2A family protein phosphatase